MRKKVLGLIMAAMTIGTFGALAQTENTNNTCTEQTQECCKKDKGDKKKCEKGDRKKGDRKKGEKGEFKKEKKDLFKGIELTSEQQTQIDQLRSECKTQREADKKADKEAKKEAREKQRTEFNAGVEKILTPEQYKIYQTNCENIKASRKEKAHKKMKRATDGKRKDMPAKQINDTKTVQ